MKLYAVAPLITDPPCAYSTIFFNFFMYPHPSFIAITVKLATANVYNLLS